MSAILVGKAKKAKTGNDAVAKLLLIVMADYANDEGLAWPSVDTLVDEIEKSPETIKRARRKLVDLGLIAVSDDQRYVMHYRADKRPKVYRILPNGVSPMTPRENEAQQRREVSPTTPRNTSGVSSETRAGCHLRPERGVTHDTQTTIEPSIPPEVVNQAREDATTAKWIQKRNQRIDAYTPSDELVALANDLHADLTAELANWRGRRRDGNLPVNDPEANFRAWLLRGAENNRLQRKTSQPATTATQPHRHTLGCQHVLDLLTPHESQFDHEGGRGSNPWISARSHLADLLNHGTTPDVALADILQEVDA